MKSLWLIAQYPFDSMDSVSQTILLSINSVCAVSEVNYILVNNSINDPEHCYAWPCGVASLVWMH